MCLEWHLRSFLPFSFICCLFVCISLRAHIKDNVHFKCDGQFRKICFLFFYFLFSLFFVFFFISVVIFVSLFCFNFCVCICFLFLFSCILFCLSLCLCVLFTFCCYFWFSALLYLFCFVVLHFLLFLHTKNKKHTNFAIAVFYCFC